MANFAPVVPLGVARWLKERGDLGNYHLLLAHDVLKNPMGYAEVYADIKDALIIMDNSLVELGHPMDVHEVVEACAVVGAKYAVMPDVLSDSEKTVKLTDIAMDKLMSINAKVNPVLVIQGVSEMHCKWVIAAYVRQYYTYDAIICVPRVIHKHLGTRATITHMAGNTGFDVHLLGFTDSLLDDVACARMSRVIGIDSAVPIRAGLQLKKALELDATQKTIPPRGDYWERDWTKEMNDIWTSGVALSNLRKMRQWIDPRS